MKTQAELYAQMADLFAEKTGYALAGDSDLAVRLQATAAQLESLYAYEDWCLRQAFAQTAAGVYLDHHAAMRGLARTAGRKAEGELTFSVETPAAAAISIPAGTVAQTAGGARYETLADAAIAAGEASVTVAARACEEGPGAAAGQVCILPEPPVGVTGVVNALAFAGGTDEEDDEALRARILSSYAAPENGTNAAFYRRLAMQVPGVTDAAVIARPNGRGTVKIVVATGSAVPDAALLQQIQTQIDAAREIAVDASVAAPERVAVDLALQITPADGVQNAAEAVKALVQGYFAGGVLGRGLVLAQLGNAIYNAGLVTNYRFVAPTQDLPVGEAQLAVLGSLTVTEG